MLCRIEFIEHITVGKIMAKKSKSSAKAESKASVKEETPASDTDMYISTPESGGIINFYHFFNGIGILMMIAIIIYIFLRYVFHLL